MLIKYSFLSLSLAPGNYIVDSKGSHLGSKCTLGLWHKLTNGDIKTQISTLFLLSLTFDAFSARMMKI